MAENMEKSFGNQEVNSDVVKAEFRKTIEALGMEGLKKAIPSLNDEQKEFLKEVLEEMKLEKGGPGSGRKGHTTPKKNDWKQVPGRPGHKQRVFTGEGEGYLNDEEYAKEKDQSKEHTTAKKPSQAKPSAPAQSNPKRDAVTAAHHALRDHWDEMSAKHGDPKMKNYDTIKYLDGIKNKMSPEDHAKEKALSEARAKATSEASEEDVDHAISSYKAKKKESMKKAHKEPIKNAKFTNEPVTNYSPEQGDYLFNEDERPEWDKRDEEIVASAEKKNQEEVRHQGGVPVEGWNGEKIDAEGAVKSPSMKVPDIMTKSEKEEAMSEKKSEAKDKMKSMIKRMQERKMPKEDCMKALSKATGIAAEKFSNVWDALAKAEGDVKEADQVKPAAALTDSSKAKENNAKGQGSDETELKAPKKADAEKPMSGKPETLANDAMKKSEPKDSYFYEEEVVYVGKDEVFKSNRFGKNAHYEVDSFIEADAANQAERLAKSTFDYENDGEFLAKGQGSDNTDLPEPKKKDAKKKPMSGEPDETADEAKAQVPALKKSDSEKYIETKTDMDASALEAAVKVKTAQPSGAFLVKSFSDADMDSAFDSHDMWKDEKAK